MQNQNNQDPVFRIKEIRTSRNGFAACTDLHTFFILGNKTKNRLPNINTRILFELPTSFLFTINLTSYRSRNFCNQKIIRSFYPDNIV